MSKNSYTPNTPVSLVTETPTIDQLVTETLATLETVIETSVIVAYTPEQIQDFTVKFINAEFGTGNHPELAKYVSISFNSTDLEALKIAEYKREQLTANARDLIRKQDRVNAMLDDVAKIEEKMKAIVNSNPKVTALALILREQDKNASTEILK